MKVLENFIWLQFADDIDMDLRKRISQEFEERYLIFKKFGKQGLKMT